MAQKHVPVLLDAVLGALGDLQGKTVVDLCHSRFRILWI